MGVRFIWLRPRPRQRVRNERRWEGLSASLLEHFACVLGRAGVAVGVRWLRVRRWECGSSTCVLAAHRKPQPFGVERLCFQHFGLLLRETCLVCTKFAGWARFTCHQLTAICCGWRQVRGHTSRRHGTRQCNSRTPRPSNVGILRAHGCRDSLRRGRSACGLLWGRRPCPRRRRAARRRKLRSAGAVGWP